MRADGDGCAQWCWKEPYVTRLIARTLSVVGDRWTMLIIRDVFLGIRRFEGIQQDLRLTPHRLSDRLRKLVRAGALRRVPYEERPPRSEYRLTEKGLDPHPLIVAMIEWGDRWMAGQKGVPVELVHSTLAGTRSNRNSSARIANRRLSRAT